MSSRAERLERSPATLRTQETSVLIVSEDPGFIHAASGTLKPRGVRVTGCLGPAHSRCNLEDHRSCPLARGATVALVDSPRAGSFAYHWKVVPSGSYAEALQRAHPGCTVVLCGAPEGSAGPTGEVVSATSSRSALALLDALVSHRPATDASVA